MFTPPLRLHRQAAMWLCFRVSWVRFSVFWVGFSGLGLATVDIHRAPDEARVSGQSQDDWVVTIDEPIDEPIGEPKPEPEHTLEPAGWPTW